MLSLQQSMWLRVSALEFRMRRKGCRRALYVSVCSSIGTSSTVANSIAPDSKKKFQQSKQSSILTLGGIFVVGFLWLSVRIDVPFAICRAASELCVDILTNLEKTYHLRQSWLKGLPWRVCIVCVYVHVGVRTVCFEVTPLLADRHPSRQTSWRP